MTAAVSAVLALSLACGSGDAPASLIDNAGPSDSEWVIATEQVFSVDDLKGLGWKSSRDFVLEYPGTTVARWGFFKTREIGVLIYPSFTVAREAGLRAAREQTATDDEGYAVGTIDRITCRTGWSGEPVQNIDTTSPKTSGVGSYIPDPSTEALGPGSPFAPQAACPYKFPTYSEFRVIGNVVVMCESDGRTVGRESKICNEFPELLGA